MLETIILDNTERLLSHTPYFAALPKHTVLHADSLADSLSLGTGLLYNPVLDIFHGWNNPAGMVRLVPDNFFTASAAVSVAETSTNILELALEPGATGRVWGYRKDSAGQDGLWLRTNSVAGTWSKIIGASNNATQHIYKKTNGELWYNDATAGNWYQLAAGAAGNTQVTAPANLHLTYSPGINGKFSFPDAIAVAAYNFGGSTFSNYGTAAFRKIDAFTAAPVCQHSNPNIANSDPLVMWDNAWPTAESFAANAICRLPNELIAYSKPAAQVFSGSFVTAYIALGDTYTLAMAEYARTTADAVDNPSTAASGYARFATSEAPYKSFVRVSMALVNRVTKATRYIGYYDLPADISYAYGATASESVMAARLVGGRFADGALGLISAGNISLNSGGNTVRGIIYTQIPLLKLDF